jgi:hypothetical protein
VAQGSCGSRTGAAAGLRKSAESRELAAPKATVGVASVEKYNFLKKVGHRFLTGGWERGVLDAGSKLCPRRYCDLSS